MSDDVINFEVDGQPMQGKKGQMIMEVTDHEGTYIPRFCYHKKLSIAANCRMCLVEVEKAPKPLPACATPIGDGMKVFTKSPKAIAAQRATMEFLLINHPLDCPICDQGGECELQDLAMGFGRDISRYYDGKRSVKDQNLGPLISTDMTRCIHCTRCVRFGEEICGYQQLGTIGRGEWMKISTYIAQTIDHELSANIIDVCPVGALNNKPYRYSARAWEMMQHATISPHDCVGSNMYVHSLRGTIKRVVPKENEAINETWLSDRDRFSYEGVYSDDRLLVPQLKENGRWREIGWEEALQLLAEKLSGRQGDRIGILASPSATVEEAWLLARLADGLGSSNLDHRLRRRNFADQQHDPIFPWLGCDIAAVQNLDAALVVGSNLRQEAPILAHRVRKAALHGARISMVNPQVYSYFFEVAPYLSGEALVDQLTGIAVAASNGQLPEALRELCDGIEPTDAQREIAGLLAEADDGLVLVGALAARDPDFAAIRALSAAIADATGTRIGYLSDGSNTAGAHLAGLLPHRRAGGVARESTGLDAGRMLDEPLDALLLLNVEPGYDHAAGSNAVERLAGQPGFVAALSSFASPDLLQGADLLLPVGTFAETSGTYVNCEGRWQSFGGVASALGQARPAWKVLRVLGNLLNLDGFDYLTSEAVRDELKAQLGDIVPDNAYKVTGSVERAIATAADSDVPIYAVDAIVRRAVALQLTPAAARARADDAAEQQESVA
ncbi:MAG TPA: NADH-quinone oxidoreductase subunit NuoG [Woeseiaceae bacterium]|nr:NADH-quinone oxidoreductase subunit NuoG [Woeseiaceae bacterium]